VTPLLVMRSNLELVLERLRVDTAGDAVFLQEA
jgi:hypothetical protein